MSTLVTLAAAKRHLRKAWPDGDPDEADLQAQLDAAEARILNYINHSFDGRAFTATWTDPLSTPLDVQHAILVQTAEHWWDRGTLAEAQRPARDEHSELSYTVTSLLRRYTTPVIA